MPTRSYCGRDLAGQVERAQPRRPRIALVVAVEEPNARGSSSSAPHPPPTPRGRSGPGRPRAGRRRRRIPSCPRSSSGRGRCRARGRRARRAPPSAMSARTRSSFASSRCHVIGATASTLIRRSRRQFLPVACSQPVGPHDGGDERCHDGIVPARNSVKRAPMTATSTPPTSIATSSAALRRPLYAANARPWSLAGTSSCMSVRTSTFFVPWATPPTRNQPKAKAGTSQIVGSAIPEPLHGDGDERARRESPAATRGATATAPSAIPSVHVPIRAP